MVDPGLY